jgi:hypothetical protein
VETDAEHTVPSRIAKYRTKGENIIPNLLTISKLGRGTTPLKHIGSTSGGPVLATYTTIEVRTACSAPAA